MTLLRQRLSSPPTIRSSSTFCITSCPGQKGTAYIKGDTKNPVPLTFVRVEPYVIPKTSLTGASTERVDTRVLQVIYSLQRPKTTPIYVGQQVDVYIDAGTGDPRP